MNEMTLSNGSGGRVPNLEAHGLQWKEAQKLAEELDNLWTRQKQEGRQQGALDEDIRRIEGELAEARAHALRGGPEPSEKPLEKAKEKLAKSKQSLTDLRRAAEYAQGDLHQVVAQGREEWAARAQAKGAAALEEAAEAAAVLSEKLASVDRLASAYQWIESSGAHYTPAVPAPVDVGALVYERQRALGLLEVGVVG